MSSRLRDLSPGGSRALLRRTIPEAFSESRLTSPSLRTRRWALESSGIPGISARPLRSSRRRGTVSIPFIFDELTPPRSVPRTAGSGSCFVSGRPGHPRFAVLPAFFRYFEIPEDSHGSCYRFAVLPAFFRDFEIPEGSRLDDVGFGSCLSGCAWANPSSHRF
jgi:hypothetical protein